MRIGCVDVDENEYIHIASIHTVDIWWPSMVKFEPPNVHTYRLVESELLTKPSPVYTHYIALKPFVARLGRKEYKSKPITVQKLADRLNLKTEWLMLRVAWLKTKELLDIKPSLVFTSCVSPFADDP